MASFYIDTCIWLNLFKKEGNPGKGKPYWQIMDEFLEKYVPEGATIYYSGFVLKELKSKLSESEFRMRQNRFWTMPYFVKLNLTEEEFLLARAIESELKYEVSFYDILHLLLSRKSNSVLITRDKKLLAIAANYSVIAKKPEWLL